MRQCPSRQTCSSPPRNDWYTTGCTQREYFLDFLAIRGQNHYPRELAIGSEPITLVRPQLLRLCQNKLSGKNISELSNKRFADASGLSLQHDKIPASVSKNSGKYAMGSRPPGGAQLPSCSTQSNLCNDCTGHHQTRADDLIARQPTATKKSNHNDIKRHQINMNRRNGNA